MKKLVMFGFVVAILANGIFVSQAKTTNVSSDLIAFTTTRWSKQNVVGFDSNGNKRVETAQIKYKDNIPVSGKVNGSEGAVYRGPFSVEGKTYNYSFVADGYTWFF